MKKIFTFLLIIIVSTLHLCAQKLYTSPFNVVLNNDNYTAILASGSENQVLINHFKGIIITPNNLAVNNVLVQLNNLSFTTSQDGKFDFDLSLLTDPNKLNLSFFKDDSPKNGVSVLDLYLFNQHILQKNLFPQEWQKFAGDANSDKKLTVGDQLEIRKVILGIVNSFQPYSESWKFLSTGITYDPSNPDSIYNITAVKLGDVNGNADPSKFIDDELEVRGDPIVISSKNIKLYANKSYRIDFNLEQKEDIAALQFTLEGLKRFVDIQAVIPGKIASFSDQNYNLFTQDNLVTVSWENSDDISYPKKSILFTLIINVKHNIDLINAFKISSKVTKSEGYNSKGEAVPISLDINGDVNNTNPLSFTYGPNPVQNELQLNMELPKDTDLKMYLIDNLGRSYHPVFDNKLEKGYQALSLDFSSYANGVYFLQIEFDGVKQALQKLMIYR
ncbi:MAG TPA: T9SS type A sorting domain-containing protein [Saprospiraceae bacterium]|nr:T9SS type A sorting domain-containing protein [Saprospiraceae bacterium]